MQQTYTFVYIFYKVWTEMKQKNKEHLFLTWTSYKIEIEEKKLL